MTAPTPFSARPGALAVTVGVEISGALLLTAAWYGASGEVEVGDQVPWLILGVAGMTLAAVANVGWLVVGRRRLRGWGRSFEAQGTRPFTTEVAADAPVAVPGMARYHRPNCLLVRGKAVERADVAAHGAAGRNPCRTCQP